VRDLLHVEDLVDLLDEQIERPAHWDGVTVNVGGGREVSLSLRETTELCAELTGRRVEVSSEEQTRPGDVPIYVSDCRTLFARSDWRPRRSASVVLSDIHKWILDHEDALASIL
jgi:CDP-paratose 2-epimerase